MSHVNFKFDRESGEATVDVNFDGASMSEMFLLVTEGYKGVIKKFAEDHTKDHGLIDGKSCPFVHLCNLLAFNIEAIIAQKMDEEISKHGE